MIWKHTLGGIALANLESLDSWAGVEPTQEQLTEHVCDSIRQLPWHFRIPIIALSTCTGAICWLLTRRLPDGLSIRQRRRIWGRVSLLPLMGMLNKLVRATSLLRFYDALSDRKGWYRNLKPQS